ncbi:MAG: hypothetical protein JWN72_447 [Thermoleophilia bacterium]|nr:hypothetical protein [Thermoleophilia bacterium]
MRRGALPISARLTAAFALALSVVLLVTSLWIYERQREGYRASLGRELRERRNSALEVLDATQARDDAGTARRIVAADSGLVQLYDRAGAVVDSSVPYDDLRVASRNRIRAALERDRYFDAHVRTHDGERVLLTRLGTSDLVAAFTEPQRPSSEALERLAAQLAFGAAVAVLLGSLLAFSLARAALRPVEQLRMSAERHGRDDDDVSLDVPPARDEIARLAVTLNALLARMREATLRERRFVAEAGHELRTPLATMIAEIEFALEGDVTKETAATLNSLHEEATHLTTLSQQLLNLATTSSAAPSSTVDLAAVVRRRVERAASIDVDRSYTVEANSDAWVVADPDRLAQVIDNLLDNASVHGGSSIVVQVTNDGITVELHVLDDGPGIAAGDAARAFDRFMRADDARSRPGTGLGLSIVRAAMLASGGDCGIRRRTDGARGTDAWISLPSVDRHA